MTDNVMNELSTLECQALLGSRHLGRLAFLDGAGVMPMVLRKLIAALHGAPVALEVDGADEQPQGWSVVVRGFVEELSDPNERAR